MLVAHSFAQDDRVHPYTSSSNIILSIKCPNVGVTLTPFSYSLQTYFHPDKNNYLHKHEFLGFRVLAFVHTTIIVLHGGV